MGRQPAKLPHSKEGHSQRLRRVQDRSEKVLKSPLAQRAQALWMGAQFRILGIGTAQVRQEFSSVDWCELAYTGAVARPFTLRTEDIYYADVAAGLTYFAVSEEQRVMCTQVSRMWKELPGKRMKTFAQTRSGVPLLPPGGVWDGEVGHRVLYSQVVHADDAQAVLGHIDSEQQAWSLAGLVGDWVAIVAHQQALLHWVRPDLCSHVTSWAGTPDWVFTREGLKPEPFEPS